MAAPDHQPLSTDDNTRWKPVPDRRCMHIQEIDLTTSFDCPRCGTTLSMTERQGVEIDYCPQCRGVWLDRGELDKLIERAEERAGPAAAPSAWTAPQDAAVRSQGMPQPYDDRGQGGGGKHGGGHGGGHGGRSGRRRSWLGELFD